MTLGPVVGGIILDYLNLTGVFHMAATLLFVGAAILLLTVLIGVAPKWILGVWIAITMALSVLASLY